MIKKIKELAKNSAVQLVVVSTFFLILISIATVIFINTGNIPKEDIVPGDMIDKEILEVYKNEVDET